MEEQINKTVEVANRDDLVIKKRRGRKPKDLKEEYVLNMKQTKFFIDLSKANESLKLVQDLLVEANKKDLGDEITIKELAINGIKKLNSKDIERIKEDSLSEMEKVKKHLNDYNLKNNTNLDLGEFLVKKLNIN